MEWSQEQNKPMIGASGLNNGKIIIQNMSESHYYDEKELLFGKYAGKACTSLAWNPSNTNIIASAYNVADNHTLESVLLWDISDLEQPIITNERIKLNNPIGALTKRGKRTHCVTWHPEDPNLLFTGGSDFIRLWDIRDPDKDMPTYEMAGVKGISFDPFNPNVCLI